MNLTKLSERAHQALDQLIFTYHERLVTCPDGIVDIRLVHTTTNDEETKTTVTVLGAELIETVDGVFEIEDIYDRTEEHKI